MNSLHEETPVQGPLDQGIYNRHGKHRIMGLRSRIESVMYGGPHAGPGWLSAGLAGMARLYGSVVRMRKIAYARKWMNTHRLDCRVVSVGNITLGGTGKTPMTIYIARLIKSCGFSVAVISRGYKGSAEAKGGVVNDGNNILMAASECGDEAFMMANALGSIPVMVGRDRYAMGRRAIRKFSPQVILLDDAFQHIRLERDIDLVLLDAEKPFGNGNLIPRGILREEQDALERAGALILTRAGREATTALNVVDRYAPGKPVFQCDHRPFIADRIPAGSANGSHTPTAEAAPGLAALEGRRGYVFSGIARNERFKGAMEQAGVQVCGTTFFDDHHWYSDQDLADIMQSAAKSSAEMIITTQKDVARISQSVSWPLDLVVVGVEIQFLDDAFDQYILQALGRH